MGLRLIQETLMRASKQPPPKSVPPTINTVKMMYSADTSFTASMANPRATRVPVITRRLLATCTIKSGVHRMREGGQHLLNGSLLLLWLLLFWFLLFLLSVLVGRGRFIIFFPTNLAGCKNSVEYSRCILRSCKETKQRKITNILELARDGRQCYYSVFCIDDH